ncbi:uncharacterized protein N7496_003379 [Penicillium cataractarum]|uniref:F-box domain-containing protein n=1 Tax=Penicillium cataractarum TaxID=2100454 RepID=A0A9W9VIS0_9EURO|nr:uncharacterized protein N7496_003379 [Penicillium cataractarum]KAJ5380951.1 hypothetical protein N7496_003379 [Penicillium cataractarum]
MDSLPPKLISRVLDYIIPDGCHRIHPGISLATYATLNRRWQAVIERCTFAYLYINTPSRLEEFQQLVSTPRRRSCVQVVDLCVQLEQYDEKARARVETDEERQRNNRIFTTTISTLFRILSDWPDNSGISIEISAWSPSDFLVFKERKRRKRVTGSRVDDLFKKRYERSYLEFPRETADAECPRIPTVRKLSIQGIANAWVIEPASSVYITMKLPRLNRLDLALTDDCKWDKQLRQRLRNGKLDYIGKQCRQYLLTSFRDFARKLHLSPASVRHFELAYSYMPPRDQNYYPPDVTEGGTDLLRSYLRDFSQRLEVLRTNGPVVLGPELFLPSNLQVDNLVNLPFWPNLIDVSVEYAGVTPCGEWLLDRDPEEDEDEDEELTMDDIFGDEEQTYPEYVRIPLEDCKSSYFRTRIIAGHVDRLYERFLVPRMPLNRNEQADSLVSRH